jgi:hypothetical protein
VVADSVALVRAQARGDLTGTIRLGLDIAASIIEAAGGASAVMTATERGPS